MRRLVHKISLRERFLLLVASAVLVPLLVFYFLARQFLNWNLQILEDDLAIQDMRAAERALGREQEFLFSLAAEYGMSDDIYKYVKTRDKNELANILSQSYADRFALDSIFVFDERGEIIYEVGNWGKFATAETASGRFLLPRIRVLESVSGYVKADESVHMFAAHRITSRYEPEDNVGILLFMKRLPSLIEVNVAGQTSRALRFHSVSEKKDLDESKAEKNPLMQSLIEHFKNRLTDHLIHRFSEDKMSIFFPLSDYRGKLAGIVEVIFTRESLSAARHDVERMLLFLLVAGIIFSFALAAVLVRMTVHPALQLRKQVIDIRQSRDLSKRVVLASRDEMGQLADAFNHLLHALQSAEKELLRKNQELFHLSTTDELTELHNRRHMTRNLEKEFARARRYDHELSCMILDLDHFKNVNDTYGHASGDQVLRDVAELLRRNTREVDIVGRWGGEEFLVILLVAGEEEAYNYAERIRVAIEEHTFGSKKRHITLTGSVGVVTLSSSGAKNTQDILKFADEALYQAKSEGRNRTVVYKSGAYKQSDFLKK